MKRLAGAVLVILGMAASSIGLAQSVKFAVGQTWTGTFQGFGTWTVKFSELDDDGDPRGITSAGPDERTAGAFDSNGRPAFYTVKNGDSVICYASSATAQNGLYSGAITRQQGNATPQKLGTPCAFSQVTASSSQLGGAAAWPPSAGLSAGVTLRFEGRQAWTLSITGKDSDGDWTGKATGADGKTATLFSYMQDDGTFVFQLSIQNANGAAEYCEVARSGSSASGYVGTRYYKVSKDAKVQADGQCRVITGSAGGAAPAGAVWPPSNLLREGVTLRLETRQVWTGSIAGKDDQGDWTGKLTGANGTRANVFAYLNDNGTFEFQIAYTLNSVAQYEYCTLDRNGSPVSPGIYAGKRYFAPSKDAQAQPDGDCRVVIGAVSSQVNPQPSPPSPQPQPQPPTVGPALPWPSNIAVGQTWRVSITGAQAASFTLNLTGVDEYETPSGKLGVQTISMFPSRSQESTVIEIIGAPGTPIISCTFKGAGSVRGSSLVGGKVQTRFNRGALPVEQPGTCEATLVSGGSAAAVAPMAPTAVTPATNPQIGTPPVTTAWPLKLEVGQSWRAEIQGVGSWNVNFNILDRDGYPKGIASPNGAGATLDAAFFYFQDDNDMRLRLTTGDTLYRCIFERNEINGLTFSGWRYVDSADGQSLDKTDQRCTMQYLGRVTLSSLLDPLAGFASSAADSHPSN